MAEFVKLVIDKLYDDDNDLAMTIYRAIADQDLFEDADDISDDLRNIKDQSMIITTISEQLQQDEETEWTEEDNKKLYVILSKIYIDNVLDINEYDDSMFSLHLLTERVMNIVHELNKTMNKKINANNVRLLLQDPELNELRIESISRELLTAKAKEHGVKPLHAWTIYTKLQPNEQEYQTDDDDDDEEEEEQQVSNASLPKKKPPKMITRQRSMSWVSRTKVMMINTVYNKQSNMATNT